MNLEVENKKSYRQLSSKIIVANHPSILDIVMLISLIPNTDCIVANHLSKGILSGIVRQLYILNSHDLSDILKACDESLKEGNCLIIFPEGTRTPRSGKITIKKGAARIAIYSGCSIVPLHIGGTDKYGLGKRDPWTGFNPTERYIYRISIKPEIHPEQYKNLSGPAATQALTNDIKASLFPELLQTND
ncbi:MAG: 1-acyl-sn-glycerol-3-phosphate acyltransferase [Spirochaetes bacterium]|nr:1-acyl-sn-glycerol-3-phosphate acyltransferase [Spirochaetota bacterium]